MQLGKEMLIGRRTKILLLSFLVVSALLLKLGQFKSATGKDFLQFWWVAQAQVSSSPRLENPYIAMDQYGRILKEAVQNSTDLRFQEAEASREQWVLNQTPLCYLLFAYFPADYSTAFGIFYTLAILLFLASFILLSSVYRGDWFWFLFLGLILVIIYDPLLTDLDVGNLNAVQLFGLALSLWLAERLTERRRLLPTAIAFPCLLAFLILLKPNLLPIILLLGAHVWARHGFRAFAQAGLWGAAFGSLLIILSCLWFHSGGVWLDWFKYARSLDQPTLLAKIKLANFSPAILLSQALGTSLSGTVAALATGLGTLLALALVPAMPCGDRGLGGWWRAAVGALRDPNLCIAIGVLALLIVSPLVWIHYYVLALLPASWLLWNHDRRLANLAGGLTIFLASGLLLKLIPLYFWGMWVAWFYAFTSIPLLVGVLALMAAEKCRPGLAESAGPGAEGELASAG